MKAKRRAKKRWSMPAFASERDEVRWWDDPKHRREFWQHAVPVDRGRAEKREVVLSVRLSPRHASKLKQVAEETQIGHVTLLRRVVESWLDHVPGKRGTAGGALHEGR